MVIIANGVIQHSLGQRPRLWIRFYCGLANGHIQASSVPDVLLIEFDTITIEELSILFLKGLATVMFFLRRDIRHDVFAMGGTDGENPVTTLPKKFVQIRVDRFDEL
jgi:hypothetical protein